MAIRTTYGASPASLLATSFFPFWPSGVSRFSLGEHVQKIPEAPPIHRDRMPLSNPFVLVVRWLPFARNLGCLDCLFRFRLSSLTFVCCSYTPLFQPPLSWAHRSGNSCPLRPTRLLLSRLRPQHHWVPPRMQPLACDSQPPRSLSCPQETGAENEVILLCTYMLSGIASS